MPREDGRVFGWKRSPAVELRHRRKQCRAPEWKPGSMSSWRWSLDHRDPVRMKAPIDRRQRKRRTEFPASRRCGHRRHGDTWGRGEPKTLVTFVESMTNGGTRSV